MKKILLKESQVKYIIDNLMEQGDIGDPRYRDRKAEKETRRAQKNYKEGPLDWGGGFNGGFNFLSQQAGAVNVGNSLYKISYHTMANNQGKAMPGKQTPPKETPPQKEEPTLSTFTVQGSSLPYADNMVKPYFDKYPDALATFNGILTKFVDYLKTIYNIKYLWLMIYSPTSFLNFHWDNNKNRHIISLNYNERFFNYENNNIVGDGQSKCNLYNEKLLEQKDNIDSFNEFFTNDSELSNIHVLDTKSVYVFGDSLHTFVNASDKLRSALVFEVMD